MQPDTRLIVVYQRVEPYLYGSISVVGPEAIAKGGSYSLGMESPIRLTEPHRSSRHGILDKQRHPRP